MEFDGVTLTLDQRNRYFMLHKPEGYVCSNEDPDHPTVFFLMDEPAMGKLHVVGRLDLDTTGLVLVTDDGQWSHRITSPATSAPRPTTSGWQTRSARMPSRCLPKGCYCAARPRRPGRPSWRSRESARRV